MRPLVVVDNPVRWRLQLGDVPVVSARAYLTDPSFVEARRLVVFNLCRSYGYQSSGYYVSLLAEARGHQAKPGITAIQDMRSPTLTRATTGGLSELIQKSLARIASSSFVLSIYFGRPLAKRHEALANALFNQFEAPLLRAHFERNGASWTLERIGPIPASAVPDQHLDVLADAAEHYFTRRPRARRTKPPRFHLAILWDPEEPTPPSDPRALRRFVDAARRQDVAAELITRNDFARVGEYDALFLRATTGVHHYTYRFARRAAAEGLAVIDDPLSIVRCTNKVYLAELLRRHRVATPRTIVVSTDNRHLVAEGVGMPCVLKQPDSSFSIGVVKANDEADLQQHLDQLLENSDLVVAQEFAPTDYDWRVGVLDGEPLYACRYFMARHHWQIAKNDGSGKPRYGRVEAVALDDAPPQVVRAAVRAARLFGAGLYGVDVKLQGRRCRVIEVNDNPTIEAGCEDAVQKRELYDRIIQSFIDRIEQIHAP